MTFHLASFNCLSGINCSQRQKIIDFVNQHADSTENLTTKTKERKLSIVLYM